MRFWVESLIDACSNISCTNVIYKHIHHALNGVKKNLSTIFYFKLKLIHNINLSWHGVTKNVIYDSTILYVCVCV